MQDRRVVAAACRVRSKPTIMVISARHFDNNMHMIIGRFNLQDHTSWEQGFIDQWNVFMSRTEAWEVAAEAKQILHHVGGDSADGGTLYSENLY